MSKLTGDASLLQKNDIFTKYDMEQMDIKLSKVSDTVDRLLAGALPDPTAILAGGKGALHWGSREDFYYSNSKTFVQARNGERGQVLEYGGKNKRYGSFFFR